MQDWQAEHQKLTEQHLQAIKCGQYSSGFEMFQALRAKNFGVSANPAVRQFNKFSEEKWVSRRELAELLGFDETKNSLEEYSEEERNKIAKFVRVAKVIVPYFTAPTLLSQFSKICGIDRVLGLFKAESGEMSEGN